MSKWFSKARLGIVGGALVLALSACQTTADRSTTKLSVEEVRSTFVGRDWGQGNHTFQFTQAGEFVVR